MPKEKKKKKVRIRMGRIVAAMIGIVVVMMTVDSIRRDFFKVDSAGKIKVDGTFTIKPNDPPANVASTDGKEETAVGLDTAEMEGFTKYEVAASELSRGKLVPATAEKPALPAENQRVVDLSQYKNEFYSIAGSEMSLNEEAAEALNRLMADYYAATELNDFVVYGTTNTYTADGSVCPRAFPDSAAGNSVDLAILGYESLITYDGMDSQGWVIENCSKYGFIVRYPQGKSTVTGQEFCPWHLVYVGAPHAEIMARQNLCLEEYVGMLKDYTAEAPLIYPTESGNYTIYFEPAGGDITPVRVPIGGGYSVSGNNSDGFIVTSGN